MTISAAPFAMPRQDGIPQLCSLGHEVSVVSAEIPVRELDASFRADRTLRSVVVETPGSCWLLTRERLEFELSGRLGYGRALHSRTKVADLPPDETFTLNPRLPLLAAAQLILQRPARTRYQDFLIRGEDGPRVVSVSQVFHAISDTFRYEALHDRLTGLPNRRLLDEQGLDLIGDCDRSRVAILFIDLDSFKTVNDTFGHRAGDDVLVEFTERLRRCVRPTDVLARLGGDEFAALLIDVTADAAHRVANRILDEAAEPFFHEGHNLHISASIGLAMASDIVQDEELSQLDVLLRQADGAMLEAKNSGKGRVVWLERRETSRFARHAHIRRRLQLAVENSSFRLHYQTQLELSTGNSSSVEALLRWQDEELGDVPPAEFIPIAESVRLIHDIGRWVINEACGQARLWLDAGTPRTISINVSPIQLAADNVVADLTAALQAQAIPASLIRVEITESSAIADLPKASRQLRQLQAIGIRVDLDDFGTGYSSISMLRSLPLNTVKIDKSFIDDIDRSHHEASFVGGLIRAAHALGLKVTAEGVERREQLQVLRELGCDTAQGYLIAKPRTVTDLSAAPAFSLN
ncbi:EAL domain-containing protein [Arthrobacter sp. I2-34]|uniref:EAL domain-containing protein n=1 Tax=Arthrobacter hankyongi TaxID=2904801 RepID=A0ABS9L821_9MICC|nr:EAL domain-containing protein [Arthrobacter hankyongi]MCG2622819.1 EAL domain-containing protein [Arthrobacter hankyongi]